MLMIGLYQGLHDECQVQPHVHLSRSVQKPRAVFLRLP